MAVNFPFIAEVNQAREAAYLAYNDPNQLIGNKVMNFAGHKLLSAISFPLNAVAVGAGVAGAVAGGVVIGSVKVAIFAATLGNKQLRVPTGVVWFGERTVTPFVNLFLNSFEMITDIVKLCKKVVRKVKQVFEALHLQYVFTKIADVAERVVSFIGRRLEAGFTKAIESEGQNLFPDHTLPIVSPLNDFRNRVSNFDRNYEQRTVSDIAVHTLTSCVTLPVNVGTLLAGGALTVLSAVAFTTKALVYSFTNLDLRFSTQLSSHSTITGIGLFELVQNTGTCLVDIPLTIYKASEATGLVRAVATIADLIFYIPRAVFTNE